MPKVDLFTLVDDAQVILRVRSKLYKQGKLYTRGDELFVGASGGYLRLLAFGGTTDPSTKWLGINIADDGIVPTAMTPKKDML
jgi:hypothetical protein